MKIIKLPINACSADKEKARKEGELLKNNPHPNIVEFVETLDEIKVGLYVHICIVMEYVDGYNLKELI